MEDVAWRARRSPRSAQVRDMAAVGRTGLAPGLGRSALSAPQGSTPWAEARAARRTCAILVPARQRSWGRRSRYPVKPSAPEQEERRPRRGWLAPHRLPQARAAEVAVARPTPRESPRAVFHRCISHLYDRRSGSASASRARRRSMRGWAGAAPWRGLDNRTPLRRRDFGCWVWFPDRGRSCWSPSNHATCRPGCMRRARAPTPEWPAGAPRTGRNGVCPSS